MLKYGAVLMNDLNQLIAPATGSLTVEIDSSCQSVYIRFKHAKVHKTLSDNRRNAVLAIDLDSRGEIIGIELVGIQNLSISQIRRKLPDRLKEIDFDRARWVSAESCRSVLVPA
jgi:uncharacterized protein YuzE